MADNDRLGSTNLRFECAVLGATTVVVEHMDVVEALDEAYSAEIELKILDATIDPVALLGQDAVLTVDRVAVSRRFCGLVRSVQEGQAGNDFVRARVVLAPALWMLTLRRNTRIFQEKTAAEILEVVLAEALGDYGRTATFELDQTYPTREYCVQYQETDFDFVHRLMEEEGIFYRFDHAGETEQMTLADGNNRFPALESLTDDIQLDTTNQHARDREVVHSFLRAHRHTVTSIVLRDFDWTTPDMLVEDEERGTDVLGRDHESYEHGLGRTVTLSEYGSRRYQKRDTPAQKKVRLEAHSRDAITAVGIGRVVGFAPGTKFTLSGHATVGVDGDYVVTRVMHLSRPAEGAIGRTVSTGDSAEPYHNRFECMPADVPHRPRRRTAKPRVPSIQTAIVTGPSGEEIHTDEHGRIKVRFHWDRVNPADETSSCWIRCEQAWSGASWGFWWLPRIGMEVVVHFIDGDPDRPMVTGCVYNGTNATPYPLPDEKTKSTIKSNSSPGGGGSNELRFEDKAGSEEIYTHAQKDYNEVVLNDHTTDVGHDQTNTVDNDQTQHVKGSQTESVGANQDLSVGGNRKVHVKGDFDEKVDGTETRTVTGAVTETFDANETRTIGASVTETIGGGETRTIGGNLDETIGASHSQTVAGGSSRVITGSVNQTVAGDLITKTPGSYTILAAGGFNCTAAAGITMSAPGGIVLIAPGGVKWIDDGDTWFGSDYLEIAGNASEKFCGFKLEVGGLQVAFVAVKFETAAIEIANKGSYKLNNGLRMGVKGVLAKSGGIGKKLAPIILEGG